LSNNGKADPIIGAASSNGTIEIPKCDIKIHGLQRSANNLAYWVFRKNYNTVAYGSKKTGCKHGKYIAFKRLGRHLPIIITVKTPFAWLVSAHRKWGRGTFKKNPLLHEWLRKWNAMNKHWMDVDNGDCGKAIVRHIDVMKNPEKAYDDAAITVGAIRTSDKFVIPENRMNQNVTISDEKFHPEYYTQFQYLEQYPGRLLDGLRNRVDMDLCDRMGLEVLP